MDRLDGNERKLLNVLFTLHMKRKWPPTMAELLLRTARSRETVEAALLTLKQRGFIDRIGGRLVLLRKSEDPLPEPPKSSTKNPDWWNL